MRFAKFPYGLLIVAVSLSQHDLKAQGVQPYPQAITDRLLHLETPMPPPAVNTPFADPDFGSLMVRVTDANTNVKRPGEFFRTDASGAQNFWSADTRKFLVLGQEGEDFAFGFDPATMSISSLPNARPGQPLMIPLRPGPTFSFLDPDLIYGTTNQKPLVISSYRFSTGALTPIVDTTTCGLQPPIGSGTGSWARSDDDVGISSDETRISISEVGPQYSKDIYVVVYDTSLGCRWYNTQTGQIGGQWGAIGTAVGSLGPYYVQHARISRSGRYMWIQVAHFGFYRWDIGTLNVTPCNIGSKLECIGYGVVGYNSYVNDSGYVDEMNILKRPLNNLAQFAPLFWPITPPYHWGQEHHFTWSNVDANDSTPVCVSGYNYDGDPIANPYDGEIFCLETDGAASTVWRFAHNRAIYVSPYFNTEPLGNVSDDGRFFLFTSTWDLQIGAEADGTPRSDVWIVKLD